jgi:diguanylate cyclase (GGDEF)-like protein/PAS domain S-box-containing protein
LVTAAQSAHRVLLVDDQPTIVAWVQAVLAADSELTLTVCLRSADAVEAARAAAPTVILQDLVMPGIGGLSLVARYREVPSLADVPVIVLSSLEDVSEKARAFTAGAADYLVKLPDPMELVSRVRAHSAAYLTRSELRAVRRELQLTVDQAPIGIATASLDGRWMRVNDTLCEMFGYTRTELMERGFQGVTHPEDLQLGGDSGLRQLHAGEIRRSQVEKRYLHRDGHVVWARVTISLVRESDARPAFYVTQIEDITARHKAEAQANTFFEHSRDLLLIATLDGVLERVNGAWTQLLGWSSSETVGQRLRDFVHPDDLPANAKASRAGGHEKIRSRFRTRDGGYRSLEWSSFRTSDGFFAIGRDMAQQLELENALREASLTDELTRLHNRRGFMVLGEQQLINAGRYGRSMVIVFTDLNGMKAINDELGHEEGDRALCAMAEVLRTTFRSADIVARLGGDEFVVLAEGDAVFAQSIPQRLQANLDRFNMHSAKPYVLSASLGVARYSPGEARSLTDLLLSADKLMYDAKRRSRASQRMSLRIPTE